MILFLLPALFLMPRIQLAFIRSDPTRILSNLLFLLLYFALHSTNRSINDIIFIRFSCSAAQWHSTTTTQSIPIYTRNGKFAVNSIRSNLFHI